MALATLLALLAALAGLLARLLTATLLLARLARLWVGLLLLVRILILLAHRKLLGVLPPTPDNVGRQESVPVTEVRLRQGMIAAKARRGNRLAQTCL